MGNGVSSVYCLLWTSACLPLEDWKDISQIIGTYVAIPGVLIAAYKTFQEVEKLRKEKERERRSRVHQRQLDELGKLYKCLEKVQAYSQLMTKSVLFEGEKPEEYPGLLGTAMAEAREAFVSARLLLPPDVVQQVEGFFKKAVEGQINFGLAQRVALHDVEWCAEYWAKAGIVAHTDMPELLSTLERSAREIIHGEEA